MNFSLHPINYLTHVASLIGFLNLADVKVPGAWLVVRYRNTRIVRHDTSVKTQNSLVIGPQPSNLYNEFLFWLFLVFVENKIEGYNF